MKYLVMECGLSYAVVMDSQGEFFKVPNLGYEVGQTLEHVVLPTKSLPSIRLQRQLAQWAVTAACLCMLLFGGWQFWKAPAGTVRMQINPDVQLTLNRFDRVLQLEGLNQDGVDLINGLSYFGQKVQDVSNQLATRAMEMGYLEQGGQIVLTAESDQAEWTTNMEERLQQELTIYLEQQIEISIRPVDDAKGNHSYQDRDDDSEDEDESDNEDNDDSEWDEDLDDDDDEDDNDSEQDEDLDDDDSDQGDDSDDDQDDRNSDRDEDSAKREDHDEDQDLGQDDDSHEDDSDENRDSSQDSDSDEEDQENDDTRSTAPRSNDDPDDDDDSEVNDSSSQDDDFDEDENDDLEEEDDPE